jgi:hypothetical protein
MKRLSPAANNKKAPSIRKVAAARPPTKPKKAPAKHAQARKPARKPAAPRRAAQPQVAALAKRKAARPKRSVRPRTKSAIAPAPRRRPAKSLLSASAAVPAKPVVPAFLLEGDEPTHLAMGGPGEKYALGPTPPLDHVAEAIMPLPEAAGSGRVYLTPRDPHWFFAHWDFSAAAQAEHNAQSRDRHLILRLHSAAAPQPVLAEMHVHPESKHWFVPTPQPGEKQFVELGYYRSNRRWHSLAVSTVQATPPDRVSPDSTVEFATIPLELPFATMLDLLKGRAENLAAKPAPLARVVDQLRPLAPEHFPKSTPPPVWTPEQAQALTDLLATKPAGAAASSPTSNEFAPTAAALDWPEFSFDSETGGVAALPSSPVSSFFGGEGQPDFWFNVNAELIVYGATVPGAAVTFAGKPIALQPDGSFRFRFALPDGRYELPVTAVSADGTDGRAAELTFTRTTDRRGSVAAAPADPVLRPPPPAD